MLVDSFAIFGQQVFVIVYVCVVVLQALDQMQINAGHLDRIITILKPEQSSTD